MQIYFGAVSKAEAHSDTSMFASYDHPDHLFYYGLEYGSNPGGFDEAVIYDSVGRAVPVNVSDIPALIGALYAVLGLSDAAAESKAHLAKIASASGNISLI